MKNYEFKTTGVCARQINFKLDGDIIHEVIFHGGCDGNAKGIANLLEGASAEETVKRLENINCQNRGTSCPAQLAIALKQAMEEEK
jgi:uncharacterized protein (TIGR03905 family)